MQYDPSDKIEENSPCGSSPDPEHQQQRRELANDIAVLIVRYVRRGTARTTASATHQNPRKRSDQP